MSVWGNKAAVHSSAPLAPIALISFKDIIQQQSCNEPEPESFNPAADDYYEADAAINDNSFLTKECSDDFKLAQLLQQIENEDATSSYESMLSHENKKHPDQNIFSKISVVSRYDSSSTKQRHVYHESNVKSSDFHEAIYRDNQLSTLGVEHSNSQMFKGGVTMLPDGQFVSKHDSLLNSLSNSVKLSEIEGVGDLSGQGLLIGNSVANSIRSAAQKRKNK